MRFLFAANIADSRTTGMGRQMYGLGDALAGRGHEVRYRFAESLPRRLGRKLSRLEFPLRLAADIRRAAARDLGGGPAAALPIALLHEPVGWASALFARRQAHTVAMVHNCEPKCWQLKLRTRTATGERVAASSRVIWPLTELTQAVASLRTAEAVVCLSTEDRRYIVDRLHVAADRVHRIDNGVEPAFLRQPPPGLDRDRDLLFLGHWLPHKGIRVLTAALERLSAGGLRARLTLAGTSSTADEIRASLPVAWRADTEILPRVAPEELIALYRRHRIFVLPSIWEGIPLSMLEAMACGLCPVMSNVGGVPDVVTDGVTGLLVPRLDAGALAAALAGALRSPERVRALGTAAQTHVQAYGWDRVAGQLEAICARFAGERSLTPEMTPG